VAVDVGEDLTHLQHVFLFRSDPPVHDRKGTDFVSYTSPYAFESGGNRIE
jgi:hypothetical protein